MNSRPPDRATMTDERLYRGPIVDAHHHLWDFAMGRHVWLQPSGGGAEALGNIERLRRDYLVGDYLEDARNQPIAASVHIEALWDRSRDPVEETAWLDSLDKPAGIADRYVAFAPLADPDAERVLEAQAAHRRVVGIREMLSWHPDPAKCFAKRPGVANDPAWRRGVALLGRYGLHLELMLYPYQADEVHLLAKDFPDLQIILNHCGSPIDRDGEGMKRWRSGLRRLAGAPNIAIKISAMAGYDPAPTPDSLREVAMHCFDCFGVSRTMFGTDYPVERLSMGFDEIVDGLRLITAELAPEEQRAFFHDNARRYYRMSS
jgi:predicted TIM-barrel fold metal-dependent hydrolase